MKFNYDEKQEPISATESFCSSLMDYPSRKSIFW